jgi:hypothetical protein
MVLVVKKSTRICVQFLVNGCSPVSEEWASIFLSASIIYCQKLISEAAACQGMPDIFSKSLYALDVGIY